MAEETGPGTPADPPASAGAAPERDSVPQDILYLGLDLGTANSSVATSTNITRTVPSVVGWPKDLVAYKFLQKPIVYGEECIRNRMTLDLFYPLENGVLKHRPNTSSEDSSADNRETAAVEELVRHAVGLAEIGSNQTTRAVVGAPALASINDKQAIIDVIQNLVDAVMVVSEPFLVAYGMGLYNNALVVDVGAGRASTESAGSEGSAMIAAMAATAAPSTAARVRVMRLVGMGVSGQWNSRKAIAIPVASAIVLVRTAATSLSVRRSVRVVRRRYPSASIRPEIPPAPSTRGEKSRMVVSASSMGASGIV